MSSLLSSLFYNVDLIVQIVLQKLLQGHTVVGCEWVDSVCTQFFTENNIPFTKSPIESFEGSLHQVNFFRLLRK